MRQGQQNRRNRGRGRSRAGNPLTKTYESNGPDVKIKGTAADIAQKYMALARDQLSSGNTVTAENYLQHAEHYNRIIMAAQAKQEEISQQHVRPQNGMSRFEAEETPDDDDDDDDGAEEDLAPIPGYGEQPVVNIEIATPAVAIAETEAKPRRRQTTRPQRRPISEANGARKEAAEVAGNVDVKTAAPTTEQGKPE